MAVEHLILDRFVNPRSPGYGDDGHSPMTPDHLAALAGLQMLIGAGGFMRFRVTVPQARRAELATFDRDLLHLLPCLPVKALAADLAEDMEVSVAKIKAGVERLMNQYVIELGDGPNPEIALHEESYRRLVAEQTIGGAA